MFYLIYVSSATKLIDAKGLTKLLQKARITNAESNITGMLLYENGNFMQLIEGEETEVLALYETIKQDPRHKDVYTIVQGTEETRMFSDWSMGFCDMQEQQGNETIEQYMSEHLKKIEPENIRRFIKSFYINNL